MAAGGGADHAFAGWPATGRVSAYAGGLWLAAVRAAGGLAAALEEPDAAASADEALRKARRTYEDELWVPDAEKNPSSPRTARE